MPIPRWGRVVAAPHEFLIHIRRGRLKTQGRGASCFKWPSDSVALIPTSIGKLSFSADQVTREKIGVEVTGLAVFRIVEPLVAYGMIDGDLTRLGEVLRDMFVGATRRIVATLSLEECITHRKERVAHSLMNEIAPVLAGQGMPSDATQMGWGVIIDTIEIQNVRVLSEEVFQRIQAPFRESLALAAMQAREKVEEERARLELERARASEAAKRQIMEAERERMLEERARDEREHAHQLKMREVLMQGELRRDEEKRRASRRALDLDQDAEIERGRKTQLAKDERAAREREDLRLRAELDLEIQRNRADLESEIERRARELEAHFTEILRKARVDLTEAQLREILMTETMPRVAEAFRGSFDRISVHQSTGGSADGLAFLTAAIQRVLGAVDDARLEVSPRPGAAAPPAP